MLQMQICEGYDFMSVMYAKMNSKGCKTMVYVSNIGRLVRLITMFNLLCSHNPPFEPFLE